MSRSWIRIANLSDLVELMDIEVNCFSEEQFNDRQMRYLLTRAKAQTWIARRDGQAVGYCLCLTPQASRPARIYGIGVKPEYRKMGVATALIKRVKKSLSKSGYQRLRLEVSDSNIDAQTLYSQLGFVPINRKESYYSDGSDALCMECNLRPQCRGDLR